MANEIEKRNEAFLIYQGGGKLQSSGELCNFALCNFA